jgi:protein SCO1/2
MTPATVPPSSSGPKPAGSLQDRISALVGKPLFWFVFVGLLGLFPILRALSHPVPPPPALKIPLGAFTRVDQQNKPFGLEDLKGRVWVADFVFISCPSVCPKLTTRMAQIQRRARHLGQAFHLVTFTVDPENDTPPRLAAYAAGYHADPSRWTFLTGKLGDIETTVVKGFKVAMGKEPSEPGSSLMSIFHGEKLVLVDADGNIRGYYDADDAGIDEMLRNTEILVNVR